MKTNNLAAYEEDIVDLLMKDLGRGATMADRVTET